MAQWMQESACNAGDIGEEASSILGSEISAGGGRGNRKSFIESETIELLSTAQCHAICSVHACFVTSIVFDSL